MSKKYIVAIDQGTTSCRALLVDNEGVIIETAQQEFTQLFPKSGWVEHDANEIWDTQFRMFKKVLSLGDVSGKDIVGIGITNQRETTVVWDKRTGEPIYNAIVWQDKRTAGICEDLKKQGLTDYVRENTGLVIDSYFSGTKVKWILDSVSGARELADEGHLLFGTIDTWLIWKMTGGKSHVTDHTNASRTMIYNIASLTWDEKMLQALSIPSSMLPMVQCSSSHFGDLDFEGTTIPICGVAGDQQSALFGQACFEPGMAKNTYGTGCFLLLNTGSQLARSKNGLLTTMACSLSDQPQYALEGSIFIAGAAIQWLRDGLKMISSAEQTEQMAERVKDSYDVFVVPAFAGLGAPYWDMYARGAIYGLTRDSSQAHIAKATLESLAYQTKDVIDAMKKDSGLTLKTLKVDGGAVANSYLMQFQADILDASVERPKVIETTAMGAAYLAGIHVGLWGKEDVMKNREIDKTFTPEMNANLRESLYGTWQKAVKRSENWIDKEV